jgi:hypothetical protein
LGVLGSGGGFGVIVADEEAEETIGIGSGVEEMTGRWILAVK